MAGLQIAPIVPETGQRLRNEFSESELAMLRNTWPMELLEDPSKQAREVNTPEEFLRAVLVGDHIESLVVFPNGTKALNLSWEETVPQDIRRFLAGRTSGADVAQGLVDEPHMLDRYMWRMDMFGGRHKLPSTGHRCWLTPINCELTEQERTEFHVSLHNVLAYVKNGTLRPQDVYFSEVARREPVLRPGARDRNRLSVFSHDVKDLLGPKYGNWNLKWSNNDAGLFVGGRLSGTGLHVDRSLWSDVGRNFLGHKLVAVWPMGATGAAALAKFAHEAFQPPLDAAKLQVLKTAAKVTLLRPGDLYVFSGGVGHSVLCVSEDEMCVGSYESAVTLHPRHVQLWKHKGIPNMKCDHIHCIGYDSEPPNRTAARPIKGYVQNLIALARQIETGRTSSSEHVVRPAGWDGILRALDADAVLQATFRAQFSEAVGILMRNKLMRAVLPRAVLRAAGWEDRMHDPSLEDEYYDGEA